MKMTPRSLSASMVKPWKSRRHCDVIPHVHMQRSRYSDKSGDSSLPFLCPSPLPRLFFHISLSFHLPSPLSCCLFIFKALPPSPDCKAYKYSIFPRSSLWMIFHYSVSLTHPIRNGARVSSGSLPSTPLSLHDQHGGLIFLSKVVIIKGRPTVTLEPFMDSNLDRR